MGIQIPYNGQWIDISASSAEKLSTARTIALTGDATGNALFDGSASINIPLTVNTSVKATQDSDGNVIKNTYLKLSGGTINGSLSLIKTGDASLEIGRIDGTSSMPYIDFHAGATATDYDVRLKATIGTGVAGDGTLSITAGNTIFSGTITGNLIGDVTGNVDGNVTGDVTGNLNGNVTGDVTGNLTGSVTGTASNASAIATVSCYTGTTNPTATTRLNINGYLYATRVYNAVLNDYAECFVSNNMKYEEVKNRIVEIDDNGYVKLASTESKRVIGIISDSYAFLIGGTEDSIKQGFKMPVGLAGVLMVDSEDIVSDSNIGKFICSGMFGLAKISATNEDGTIVGKIIGSNKEKNQYKVVLVLR